MPQGGVFLNHDSFLVLPFVSESPLWLVIRGRNKEAMDILSKLARINGRRLPTDLITISNPTSPGTAGGGNGGSLWSARWAVKRMVLTMATGFGVGFVYYGVQLNVENLSFSRYLSVAVNGIMEIPAVILGSVLLSFMGRRALFSSSAALAGAACLLCIPFAGTGKKGSNNKGRNWAQLVAEAVGFMAVSTAFDVLYVYCVEMFPTNVRNFAVSMLRQALMLGAAVAPQLVVLGRVSPKLSFVVFGCFALFSGALTVWLPETRNAPLYETMQQQETEERRQQHEGLSAAAGAPAVGSEVEPPAAAAQVPS